MLGCQRCGGLAAAAPVSDVMLRSSFSAPLPSSVEDAAAREALHSQHRVLFGGAGPFL